MKEVYEKNMIERAKKEIRSTNNTLVYQPIYGEKISADGIEFFNSIKGVKVLSHDVVIAEYYFEGQKLYYYARIKNIVIVKDLINLLNDHAGYSKYKITNKLLTRFENYKEVADPECALSDYELACMFELGF